MKLSEIIPKWPQPKEIQQTQSSERQRELNAYNFALTSCDREIDREALEEAIYPYIAGAMGGMSMVSGLGWSEEKQKLLEKLNNELAQAIISTMPTWLKPTERK